METVTLNKTLTIYAGAEEFKGVCHAAFWVMQDLQERFGALPAEWTPGAECCATLVYGTLHHNSFLDKCIAEGRIDAKRIAGRRESFQISVVEHLTEDLPLAIVILGSDKRGTIYGLLDFSRRLGISPLIRWNLVHPTQVERLDIPVSELTFVSKEPSVRYRGFFINDEWPAFGTWAETHFGGINAECYEHVFELLLRLKGNYLWPAMWDSNFYLGGPGLESAELADELGVVIALSHHEPCMRSGQEYSFVRGRDSIYGDAWDFRTNPDGITRFWEDGLKRGAPYESVITMGMRGENDTAIMKDASLEENIDMLRQVLKVQNRLIRENISPDLRSVPRQIVLFTEVEEFFYGNEETPGLIGDPELEGVTLMLSDNNQGSTRTLPSEAMRGHDGGYGMYYHMDMHGGPHSFQWIGSTYLPKVWEQMTAAYEYGVRDIWVTNIGDIGTQELGLSFFLDLAYDIDTWGGYDAAVTNEYVRRWVACHFAAHFSAPALSAMENVIWDYTALLARRKHETMNADVYHPVHYGEADEVLYLCRSIFRHCQDLREKCPERIRGAFLSLIYYPAMGTANLMEMWIQASRNRLFAHQNRNEANELADLLPSYFDRDEDLVREYSEAEGRYFYGFGFSEHIGFTFWNDEDCKYPIRHYIRPANAPRMILCKEDSEQYVTGGVWKDRPLLWQDALRRDVDTIPFVIACGSKDPICYRITTDCPWLSFSETEGETSGTVHLLLHVHKDRFTGREKGTFSVENIGQGTAQVIVEAESFRDLPIPLVFYEDSGCVSMLAEHYTARHDTSFGGFRILRPYGRLGSAVKPFPVTIDWTEELERPWLQYDFIVSEAGEYDLTFHMSATTPVTFESRQYIGFSIGDAEPVKINTVREEEKPFFLSRQWEQEAYEAVKIATARISCQKGRNSLRFYAMSPGILLEKLFLCRVGTHLPESYLGPRESFFFC